MAVIRGAKAKSKKKSKQAKITVTIGQDNSNSVKSVSVYIPTIEGQPNPEPENISLSFEKMDGSDRLFSYDNLNFSSDPSNFTYEMTATMKDGSGNTIGSPLTEAVLIEAPILV